MDWPSLIDDTARRAGHALDRDVVLELATHAQAAYDAACARGSSIAEAETTVHRLIDGWIANAASLARRPRRTPAVPPPSTVTPRPLTGILQDVRYALRLLVRQPGFSAIAALTIALAIGVMTTLVSVTYGVLMRPLPWVDPARLVRLTESRAGATRQTPLAMTNASILAWLDRHDTVDGIGVWQRSTATITTGGAAERVSGASMTSATFAVLRAVPIAGRLFSADDADEAVLSYGLWQDHFAGDPSVVGQALVINGHTTTITGIMPRDFMFPDRQTRLWRPMKVPPTITPTGASSVTTLSVIARLGPRVSPGQAATEATARAQTGQFGATALMAMYGSTGAPSITAIPVLDALTGDVRQGLIALVVAVSLLLLTAIANIASLQLARSSTRYRELAIRAAIGAGSSRLVRQLFVENLLLAGAGGALGVALSAGLHRALPSILPADFPRLDDIALTANVALFALALTTITGVLLGVLPAWHLRRLRLVDALAENSSGAIGGARTRTRTAIMTAQVAIACVLLVSASLVARSFVAMIDQDRGYNPSHVLSARFWLTGSSWSQGSLSAFYDTFLERAHALPGVTAVSLTTGLPLSGSENLSGFTMPSVRPPIGATIQANAVRSVVTPEYFAALGLRLLDGRGFTSTDDSASAPRVVVVNRTFAKKILTDAPVGNRIRNFMRGDGIDFEVIGVVDDMIRKGLTDPTQPEIYSLLHQSPGPSGSSDLVIRTSADPASLADPLRALVKQISPAATIESIRTMDDRIAGSLSRPRLYAVLLTTFAASALAIAIVGLVGVLSYAVALRSREIALRTALGARPGQIFGLVFMHGMAATAAGLGAGLVLALISARFVSALLYGVSTHDTASFVAVPSAIFVIAFAACLAPALRAMRIDPLIALK